MMPPDGFEFPANRQLRKRCPDLLRMNSRWPFAEQPVNEQSWNSVAFPLTCTIPKPAADSEIAVNWQLETTECPAPVSWRYVPYPALEIASPVNVQSRISEYPPTRTYPPSLAEEDVPSRVKEFCPNVQPSRTIARAALTTLPRLRPATMVLSRKSQPRTRILLSAFSAFICV